MHQAMMPQDKKRWHWQKVQVVWRIQNQDLSQYPMLDLGDVEQMGKDFYDQHFKGKIIVLGNFGGSDTHATSVGDMHGSLILFNVYLSLREGKHNVSWLWVDALAILFTVLAYRALTREKLYRSAPRWFRVVFSNVNFCFWLDTL
jgi:hypothetical protein